MKTYKTTADLHLLTSKGLISFEPSTGGSTYSTSNPELQRIIESNELFLLGKIWVDSEEEMIVAPREMPSLADQLYHARKDGKEIVDSVHNCADARMFLQARYPDIPWLKSKTEIIKAAEQYNIVFPELLK